MNTDVETKEFTLELLRQYLQESKEKYGVYPSTIIVSKKIVKEIKAKLLENGKQCLDPHFSYRRGEGLFFMGILVEPDPSMPGHLVHCGYDS